MKKIIGILVAIIVIAIVGVITINNVKKDNKLKEEEQKEEEFTKKVIEEFGSINVFIEAEATEKEISELRNKINKLDGVREIEYVSKEKALDKLREKFKDNENILDAYSGENNIFPDSFVVKIDSDIELDNIDEIAKKIDEFDNVKKITSSGAIIKDIIKYHKIYPELTYEELIKKLKINELGI